LPVPAAAVLETVLIVLTARIFADIIAAKWWGSTVTRAIKLVFPAVADSIATDSDAIIGAEIEVFVV